MIRSIRGSSGRLAARSRRSGAASSTQSHFPLPHTSPGNATTTATDTTVQHQLHSATQRLSFFSSLHHPRPLCASRSQTANAAPSFESSSSSSSSHPAFFSSPGKEADERALREVFNSPHSLSSGRLNGSSRVGLSGQAKGLFGSPSLPSPEAFDPLAQRTLVRAQLLVSRIVSAPQNGRGEMQKVVKNLDRLSDLLCGVIDLSEFVRNAHPDIRWREAANQAYERLCGFMNVLNTHIGLYEVLRLIVNDADLRGQLSSEALSVAELFLRDFEKSGIHLPSAERERFVELSDEILVLGRAFTQGSAACSELVPESAKEEPVKLKREWFSQLHSNLLAALLESPALVGASSSSDIVLDPSLATWEFPTILRYAPSAEARRVAYTALNSSGNSNVTVLEELLRKRAQLGKLTGYNTYGEMALGDKMAKQPDHVDRFLRELEAHHRPLAEAKLKELENLKKRDSRSGNSRFDAADRDFYFEKYLRHLSVNTPGSHVSISPFFSVGNVFSGLSQMLTSLYGIRLRPASLEAGESWNSDVVKLDVMEEDSASPSGESVIGTIYADLFSREGKPPSAAHYTVRCSRRIDDDDAAGDFVYGRMPDGSQLDSSLGNPGGPASFLEVQGRNNPGRQGIYQTPIVVLLCDFVRPSANGSPSLLSWAEVETLFHEMGHAIHSMIGRTQYHNISGTRCATDFVELPSILMEHFISSPAVIDLVARHHSTGAPLPFQHLARHIHQQKALDSLDTHNQILLALLDQRLHSDIALRDDFDSTREVEELQARFGLVPSSLLPPTFGSSSTMSSQRRLTWHGSVTHLFGYGAVYYAYLFDRAIASRVWSKLFAQAPLQRENGERYKDEVLKWGGGKDGWQMLEALLREDRLDMGKVGQWGIIDSKTS